jgi:hypothetical protein
VIFATVRKSFSPPETAAYFFRFRCHLLYDNHGVTMMATMMQIDQNLSAALYMLGFKLFGGDLLSGEIAEIKGDMTIKLVHPPGEELKFVVELPGEKQMIFSVDQHQIVNLAERWN